METAHIVIDKKLLRTADQAARRTRRNRSALVRDALREHLRRFPIRDLEARDRAGYTGQRLANDESSAFEAEAACQRYEPRGRFYHFASPDKKRPVVILTRYLFPSQGVAPNAAVQ
jgi:Arc/MetJ-type ribon-helix-helix transcriptional regulator